MSATITLPFSPEDVRNGTARKPRRRIREYTKDGVTVSLGSMTWGEQERRDVKRVDMQGRIATQDEWLAFAMRTIYDALVFGGQFAPVDDPSDRNIIDAIKDQFDPTAFMWLQECVFDLNGLKAVKPGEAQAVARTS